MKTALRSLPMLGVLLLAPMAALHAQMPTKIFVASYGNDANDGSRGSPKRNFQAAHTAVADGGQIVVLDTAGYGALNISKSVAVTVPPGVNGFVTVTGTSNAIQISAAADAVVTLRGLIIEGGGSRQSTGAGFSYGIYVLAVGVLTVEDCTIRNFLDALPFLPSNSNARLAVYNTSVRNCRYGIDVQGLAGSQGANAVIAGCRLENLGDAVFAMGPDGGVVALVDSVIAHCDTGFHFASQGSVSVSNCKFTHVKNLKLDNGAGTISVSFGNNTLAYTGSEAFNITVPLK
jgi:hypothetical protein